MSPVCWILKKLNLFKTHCAIGYICQIGKYWKGQVTTRRVSYQWGLSPFMHNCHFSFMLLFRHLLQVDGSDGGPLPPPLPTYLQYSGYPTILASTEIWNIHNFSMICRWDLSKYAQMEPQDASNCSAALQFKGKRWSTWVSLADSIFLNFFVNPIKFYLCTLKLEWSWKIISS